MIKRKPEFSFGTPSPQFSSDFTKLVNFTNIQNRSKLQDKSIQNLSSGAKNLIDLAIHCVDTEPALLFVTLKNDPGS